MHSALAEVRGQSMGVGVLSAQLALNFLRTCASQVLESAGMSHRAWLKNRVNGSVAAWF